MKSEGFRKLALAMPLAAEGSHMGHPDFRVGGKIFASLPEPAKPAVKTKPPKKRVKAATTGAERAKPAARAGGRPEGELGMVKLTAVQQGKLVKERPGVFVPAAGAWGASGCTYVVLGAVLGAGGRGEVKRALEMAWENVAPRKMVEELGVR